jgi:hypothetical protein
LSNKTYAAVEEVVVEVEEEAAAAEEALSRLLMLLLLKIHLKICSNLTVRNGKNDQIIG